MCEMTVRPTCELTALYDIHTTPVNSHDKKQPRFKKTYKKYTNNINFPRRKEYLLRLSLLGMHESVYLVYPLTMSIYTGTSILCKLNRKLFKQVLFLQYWKVNVICHNEFDPDIVFF